MRRDGTLAAGCVLGHAFAGPSCCSAPKRCAGFVMVLAPHISPWLKSDPLAPRRLHCVDKGRSPRRKRCIWEASPGASCGLASRRCADRNGDDRIRVTRGSSVNCYEFRENRRSNVAFAKGRDHPKKSSLIEATRFIYMVMTCRRTSRQGGTAKVLFTAIRMGRFGLEMHKAHIELATPEVDPR